MILIIVTALTLLLSCTYAWIYGGQPERIGALCIASAALLSIPSASFYSEAELGILIIDAGLLASFVGLLIFSNRVWPIWVSGLQMVPVTSHVMMLLHLHVLPVAYANFSAFWAFPVMFVLGSGLID